MKEKISVLIVDDEPLACSRIRKLLAGVPDIKIAGECRDGEEAVAAIRKLAPDIVFLDVQMPEVDGFEVLERLKRGKMPVIVFVTAYDQYAVRAFEASALDYLLKPFDETRFYQTLSRAREELQSRREKYQKQQILTLLNGWKTPDKFPDRMIIKESGRLFFLPVKDISWVSGQGNYVSIHYGKSSYLMRETLNHLEERLDPDLFMRIHRSTIVNVHFLKELLSTPQGNYRVILQDGTELILSRKYRSKLSRFGM